MSVKPKWSTEAFYKERGKVAQRAYKNIAKHAGRARDEWVRIGEIAKQVKESAPPRSGILKRWRAEYLDGKITDVELSDCIWMFENPAALRLVRDSISNPQSVRREWRNVAKDAAASFVQQRRNDLPALAKELGATESEMGVLVAKAKHSADRAALKDAEKAADERAAGAEFMKIVEGGQTPLETMKAALDRIRGYQAKEAIAILEAGIMAEEDRHRAS